ncbi:MAG TPA: hypothetical protein VGI70_08380, partial [Polyangiales bacterium]
SRPRAGDVSAEERALRTTPEHAAENFIEAYRAHAYARAADFANGSFARALRKRADRPAADGGNGRIWVLQETHYLRKDKWRFVGVLTKQDEDESLGWPIALTVIKRDDGYFVDDLHWPKGPPTEEP